MYGMNSRLFCSLLTLWAELDDIFTSLYPPKSLKPTPGHCSVLIRVVQGQDGVEDVLVSHDTWANYTFMLRVLKRYEFYYRKVPTCSGSYCDKFPIY
jgi:hypothetical protein